MTNVTKNLIGTEDLLFGLHPVVQVRAGASYSITPVNAGTLPFGASPGNSIARMLKPQVASYVSQINFDAPNIYGSPTPLTAATLLADPLTWVPGVEVVIFHEASTAPTLGVEGVDSLWVKQGSSSYIPDIVNMIIARYLFGNRIDYVVVPADGVV